MGLVTGMWIIVVQCTLLCNRSVSHVHVCSINFNAQYCKPVTCIIITGNSNCYGHLFNSCLSFLTVLL